MSMTEYLLEQVNRHPSMQAQDMIKLCYQAAHGAEHLLSDLDAAKTYLEKEYDAVEAEDIALYEVISDQICRVNLAAWKARKLPIEWLFYMFVSSALVNEGAASKFTEYLNVADDLVKQSNVGIAISDWQEYLSEYKEKGMPAVHHSAVYREAERPAYRIVKTGFVRLLPILEHIPMALKKDGPYVVAIDGKAASGKSTMAEQLSKMLGADVIHMDDFFLPPQLRTSERMVEPGGNVHYERFAEEVRPYLAGSELFAYRKFDCSKMDYNGECIIGNTQIRIVEGSYSHHPKFGKYADLFVFSDVDTEEQLRRIERRNGEQMAKVFRDKWIPMEERYFECFDISKHADLIV